MLKRVQYNSSLLISAQIAKYWILCLIFIFSLTYTQILGDLNQDGLININDILREVNIIMEIPPLPSDSEQISADLNVDDNIEISDIIIIVDIILGNLESYCTNDQWDIPCENNYSECCYPITSHEFEWEIFNLGGLGYFSTIPYCKILAADNIWCLGQFHNVHINNPFEEGTNHFNFLHDGGNGFEMVDVIGDNSDFQNEYHLTNAEIFSSTDMVWNEDSYTDFNFYNGDSLIINVNEGINNPLVFPVIISKSIWGFNNQNLYIGYRNGYIFHWGGSTYQQMDSPVGDPPEELSSMTYGIEKIYGLDENHIYATSDIPSLMPFGSRSKLLFNNGISSSWEIIYEEPESIIDSTELHGDIYGIWGFRDSLYLTIYLSSNQLWQQSIHSLEGYWLIDENPQFEYSLFTGIDGNHYNDKFLLNRDCEIKHYNGENWSWDVSLSSLIEEYLPFPGASYRCLSLEVNEDIIIVTGVPLSGGQKFILKGTRITNE